MEVNLVIGLQKISNTILDYIMLVLTHLGDEIFILLVAALIFWCIDKRFGYRFIMIFIFGQLFTGVFKGIFKRARPYDNGARSIFSKTDGYSFPSGHTQNMANIAAQWALYTKKNHAKYFKAALIVGICLTIIVAFSRVYLGQHYPSDTIVGAALAIGIVFLFSYLFELFGKNEERFVFILLPLSIVLAAVFFRFSDEISKLSAIMASVSIGYYLEKKYVGYDVKSPKFYYHIIKLVGGAAILFLIKEGIKLIGEGFFIDYLRYFLIGIFASLIAPLIFKLAKI